MGVNLDSAPKVDVAVNVFRKPYQTAVTLLSLLRHSGHLIDKIYFTIDESGSEHLYDFLLERLSGRHVLFVPRFHYWVHSSKYYRFLFRYRVFRHSLRYQYAWESTNKKYLFLTHSDVLYSADVIKQHLEVIGDHLGVGEVGMCWNCPASTAGVCSGSRYLDYRPSGAQYLELTREHPGARAKFYRRYRHKEPWPLPECRLNEWACLIDMDKARPITMPYGSCTPIGAMYLDIGTEWFYDVHRLGYSFVHVDRTGYYAHAWLSRDYNGHALLFDEEQYRQAEENAKKTLEDEYDFA